MKKLLTYTTSLVFALSGYAQCENAYFPFQEGVSFEMTSYKSNGKETGKTQSEVTSANGNTMMVTISPMYLSSQNSKK